MGSLKKDINKYVNHYADLDNLRGFIKETNANLTLRITYPHFAIEKLDILYFRLLFESEIVEFKKEWTMRPDYTSYDFYKTVIYWPIILYVNDIESIEKYRNLDTVVIPKMSVIEEINSIVISSGLNGDIVTDKASLLSFKSIEMVSVGDKKAFPFSRTDNLVGNLELDSNMRPFNSKGITLKNLILSSTDDMSLFYKYLKNYFGMTYEQINDYIKSIYDKRELRDVMEKFFLYYGNNVRFHDYYSPGFEEEIEIISDTTRVVSIPNNYKPFIIYPEDPICPPKPFDSKDGNIPANLKAYIYYWDGRSFCQEKYQVENGLTDIPKDQRRMLYVMLEWTCPIPLFGSDGINISEELDMFVRKYLYLWDGVKWPPVKIDLSLRDWNRVKEFLNKLYFWDKKSKPVKVIFKDGVLNNLPEDLVLNICFWDSVYRPYVPYSDFTSIEVSSDGKVVAQPGSVSVNPYNYIVDGNDLIIVDPPVGDRPIPDAAPPEPLPSGFPGPIPIDPSRNRNYDVYIKKRVPTSKILPGVSNVESFRKECISELEAEVEIVEKIIEERKFVLPSKPLSETSVLLYLGHEEVLLKYGYDYVVYRQYNYTTRKFGDYFVSWEPQFVSSNSVIYDLVYFNLEYYGVIDKNFLKDIMERLPYDIFYVKYLFDACDEENMEAKNIASFYSKVLYGGTKYSKSSQDVSFDDPSIRRILVPDVIGKHIMEAKSILSAGGFSVLRTIEVCSQNRFKGIVVRQEPPPNVLVDGGGVVLYISNGEICY